MSFETVLTLIGNLADDPELRYTPTGVALCRLRVASTPRTFDKTTGAWKDGEPLFMSCTAWRDLAENAAESLAKGMRVVVTGRLRLSQWETPEGEKRSTFQLDVDEVGPSLRFATAKVSKFKRSTGTVTEDPWATASTARPDTEPIGVSADAPPF